jgi:uncharacterized protein YndB with AHSA1/START domain
MVRTEIQADIALDPIQVYEFLVDFESLPKYNSAVSEVRHLNKTDSPKSGDRFEIMVDFGIKKFRTEYSIIELIPNQKIVASASTKDLKFTDQYIFEPTPSGTKIRIIDETELFGLLSFSELLLGPIMKTQMNANLNTLLQVLASHF